MSTSLFDPADLPPEMPKVEAVPNAAAKPRFRVPVRDQVEMQTLSLDQTIESEHPVRAIWEFAQLLDVSPWMVEIRAVEGEVGRDVTHPHLLLAVWMYATLQGVWSSRAIEDLCKRHVAYRWLCGGVSLSYHTLSSFRANGGQNWKQTIIRSLATLMEQGLVKMTTIAQDGVRVRANAGAASFRTRTRLEECLQQATEQVEALEHLAEEELSQAQQAARKRAAEERCQRIQEAIRVCEELQQQREEIATKSGRDPKPPRASTTDPEARSMKMANGGYNPAVNVMFATDVETGIIVGVRVTNAGNDQGQMSPMLEQLHETQGKYPAQALVDGGFVSLEEVEWAAQHGCNVIGPLKDEKKQLAAGKNPYVEKKGDPPGVVEWRGRMQTPEAKATYKLRGQTAEWVNAQCRNRNLRQMPVRSLDKCNNVAILHALVHNFTVLMRLQAEENPDKP
jgi:transposase